MVKKALSPIVAKLSEWFFIFEAAHAQLSMIFLCSSLLCCDFFHETRLLATDSKRNQLPSLVSSARNSFRFLIHSHFHLPMLFSWFFSLFFFFFFFLILQLLLLPLFALRTIAKFYAILRLGLLPLSFLDFFGAKHTHISGLCHEVISFLFRCAHQSVSEMLKCLWSNIGCLVKMGTCKSSQICIGPRGVWVTYLWSSFPL